MIIQADRCFHLGAWHWVRPRLYLWLLVETASSHRPLNAVGAIFRYLSPVSASPYLLSPYLLVSPYLCLVSPGPRLTLRTSLRG